MRGRAGAGTGKGKAGRGGFKKSKPILWGGAKILPHPHPTTFAKQGKPMQSEVKRGWVKRGGAKLLSLICSTTLFIPKTLYNTFFFYIKI